MPFTLSHPAIVLPFGFKKHKYIDFTALFLGTMAPDFEYFYRFRIIRTVGHTLLGQVYYNLPVVLLLALVFHYIIKQSLIQHLPRPFNHWYYPYEIDKWNFHSWRRILVIIWSGLMGCYSHVIWDGFTHESGYFVQMFPVLSRTHIRGIPLYSLLQAGSSLVGIVLIMLFIFYIGYKHRGGTRRLDTVTKGEKWIYWIGVALIACLTLMIMYHIKGRIGIGNLVVYVVNGFFIGITIMSLMFNKIYYRDKEIRRDMYVE